MAKPYIFATTTIHRDLQFIAKEYHRHHGDDHVQTVMHYRVSRSADGSGGVEWLLTRFRDNTGKAMSAIHIVEHDGKREYISEFRAMARKQEKAMIEDWKRFVVED